MDQIPQPTAFMVENSHSAPTPFECERPAYPNSPRMKRGIQSRFTPEASPGNTMPNRESSYGNQRVSANDRSGATAPGHDAICAPSTESSFSSPTTIMVVSMAPNPIPEDLGTGRNSTQRVTSRTQNSVGLLSSFHPLAVVDRVYEASPEEPVEEGLMTIPQSMPPPYGHGVRT